MNLTLKDTSLKGVEKRQDGGGEVTCSSEDGKSRSPWTPFLTAWGLGLEERKVQDIGLLSGIPGTRGAQGVE